MKEYQSNSHKSKAEAANRRASDEKTITKVISGNAKTRKNEGRKLLNMFISEDATNVKGYILWDVLVPAVKKALLDIVTNGADMILYGGSKKTKSSSNISYRNYYDNRRDYGRDTREPSARISGRFDYEDIIYDSRMECEKVREQMLDIIERYKIVTVADMYEMAGLEKQAPYTSNKYGWTNISSAETIHVRDGYILKLPKAIPID